MTHSLCQRITSFSPYYHKTSLAWLSLPHHGPALVRRMDGGGGGDGAGPSNAADPEAGARWDSEQAERRRQEQAEKAAAEDVDVEVSCWRSPPAPKNAKKDGDGSSKDQPLELTDSQE